LELAEFSGGLRLHGDAARGTVKFDPMLHLHNIKALWDAVRFYVPRKLVRLRKLDYAGLSALWADKSLSPLVAHDLRKVRSELGVFQPATSTRQIASQRATPP
jgi:hypothetical protein